MLVLLAVGWLLELCSATSISLGASGTRPRHLSPVLDLTTLGTWGSTLTLDFEIPSDPHLSNLARRWYVQSDPNARSALGEAGGDAADWELNSGPLSGPMGPSMGQSPLGRRDSTALYSYLVRNGSAEVPSPTLTFKVVLQPQTQTPLRVNGELVDDMQQMNGVAYRLVETTSSQAWRRVGWARFVVHNGPELVYKGAFEVDDELGLGFPSTIYHFEQFGGRRWLEETDEESEEGPIYSPSPALSPGSYITWRDFDVKQLTKQTPMGSLGQYGPNNFTFLAGLNGHLLKRDDKNDTSGSTSTDFSLYSTVGNTTGCPNHRQVALVGLLADCNYQQQFESSQSLRQHLIDVVSQASQLYESAFNITLGLSELVLADNTSCPSNETAAASSEPWNYVCGNDSSSLGDRLDTLTSWRNDRSNDSLATWSLMTSCSAGSVVGLSWLGAVCEAGSGAVGANVISYTSLDYLVLAHEIGHSFGAVHDCTSDTCTEGLDKTSECCPRTSTECIGTDGAVYVMNPTSQEGISAFSACTQGNICGAMLNHNTNTTCLKANTGGLTLYTNNTCGNGIVEEGEECDCGGVDGCGDNPCCDPTTCKFKDGAVCDDSNEDCCSSCQFAGSSVVCRAATGPCDYAEYCTGNSTSCPSDSLVADGTSCTLNSSESGLTCMSGHCSSRDLQCQSIMGSSLGGTVKACDDESTCTLSCQSSNYGSHVCYSSSQNFLDGTPCKGSGTCKGGICQGGSSSSGSSGPGFGYGGSGSGSGGFGENWRWIVIGVAVFISACTVVAILWRTCGTRQKAPWTAGSFGPGIAPPRHDLCDQPYGAYGQQNPYNRPPQPYGPQGPTWYTRGAGEGLPHDANFPPPAPAYNDPNFSPLPQPEHSTYPREPSAAPPRPPGYAG